MSVIDVGGILVWVTPDVKMPPKSASPAEVSAQEFIEERSLTCTRPPLYGAVRIGSLCEVRQATLVSVGALGMVNNLHGGRGRPDR